MLSIINKESKIALPVQISEKLISEIRLGKIKPGKKLPGERGLAERFKTSRGTIIEALNLLEAQNYVERVSTKGTFVADDINHELSLVEIAFPFPELSITPTTAGSLENWTAISEIYHGMIKEAREHNAEISFIHFEEASSEVQFARQLRRLKNIGCAIFVSHQLSQLRQRLINNGKFCVLLGEAHDMNMSTSVDNDREQAFFELGALAKEKSYRRLKIISTKRNLASRTTEGKISAALKAFKKAGIETSRDWCYTVEHDDPQSLAELFADNNFSLAGGNDIIYFSCADTVPNFYRYCFDNGIKMGKDLGAFGYASGIMFASLIPAFTYSKINHFEMGRWACTRCIEAVRYGKYSNSIELVKNMLIKGESV